MENSINLFEMFYFVGFNKVKKFPDLHPDYDILQNIMDCFVSQGLKSEKRNSADWQTKQPTNKQTETKI